MRNTRYESPFDNRSSEWIGDMTVWLRENAPDNSEQRERLLRNLRKALKQELTPRQRQFVTMYYFEGKDMPTIAKEFGVNISTVSRAIKRGKNRLRRCLEYSF